MCLMPPAAICRASSFSPASGSGRSNFRRATEVGVGVVRIYKRDVTSVVSSPPHRQVAAGDEHQVAMQPTVAIDVPVRVDGRFEAVIGAQFVERRRHGK